jgi:dihydrofolate reductase
MTRIVYATATSLDGFLADAHDSLDWLFAVEGGDAALAELEPFVAGVGVLVEGSTTYRWVVEHERLLEHPERWQEFYGDRKTFVFTSRGDLPVVPGADVEFVDGPVGDHVDAILAAAGERDVWVMGGGGLAAQFAAAGRLDEVQLSIAPVTLGGGAPLFPSRLEAAGLRLVDVHRTGQFVQARYELTRAGSPPGSGGGGAEVTHAP